jgi:hypothetical protein
MPVLNEYNPRTGATDTRSQLPYRNQIGYVPNRTSTPVYTPHAAAALDWMAANPRIDPNTGRQATLSGAAVASNYDYMQGIGANPSSATLNQNRLGPGSPGGGGRGGGGGGGGGAAGLTQAQMDYIAQLLGAGRPQQEQFSQLNMPAYTGMPMRPFDASIYDFLQNKFGQAVNTDRSAIEGAYNNLDQYLNSNYKNAFAAGPPPSQPQGMDQQAMARMMQAQGVNPNNNQQLNNVQQGAAGANAAFGNLWGLLGANEDTAQRQRLVRSQQDRGTSNQALNIAALQGETGIGLQRTQAQQAYQQQADQRAYQDYQMQQQLAQQAALANWQRQNQVSDTNVGNTNDYNTALIQQLIGLIPNFQGNMPQLSQLGLPQ